MNVHGKDKMDIDPRLRETPSAGHYNLQPRPPNAQIPIPIAPQSSRSEPAIQHYQSFQASSPPNYYLPQTPQSGDNATDNDAGDGNNDGGKNDPKRSRACEACRGLKVKCEPNPNGEDRPCKRCAKANRVCTTTEPTRKRQKKTDSRVAELERKVEDLTAMLAKNPAAQRMSIGEGIEPEVPSMQARPNTYQQVTNGSYAAGFSRSSENRSDDWGIFPAKASSDLDNRKASAAPMVVAGQKRKHVESAASESPLTGIARKSVDGSNPPQSAFLMDATAKRVPIHVYSDVIDRGLVTADQAAAMFDCYVRQMAPHLPAVVFELDTTMAQIRKTKPTLFLAILAASSGSNFPNIQKQLTKEVMAIYAERIIGNGEKNLELIQALQVSSLWYYPPEHFEELKFYQLIHIAAVMAIDIGLDKRSRNQGPGLWRDHQWRRTPYPESASIEARRAWLGCYFLCSNAAMGLRRPNLIRWTPFMQECVEILGTSPDAAPSDRALCAWVFLQHVSEQVGTAFCMDDPSANVSMSDPTVHYALKGFENSLEIWSKEVLPQVYSPTLKMSEHVINLYTHEIALHVNHNVEEFKPPFTEDALRGVDDAEQPKLTPAHVKAVSDCLKSVDGIFDTFLELDVETVRCLPVINFVRVAYATVVLIKMYYAAVTPNSEVGKVFDKDNLKVERYLDGLCALFSAACAEEKSRTSHKFLMVLMMLKTWFGRQQEGKPPQPAEPGALIDTSADASSEKQDPQQRSGPQTTYNTTNTPLQLLSEVATGNSGGQPRASSSGQYAGGSTGDWQQPQQPNFTNYPSMTQDPTNSYGNMNAGNIDPSLGFDYGLAMGDNLEQAMGMAIGVGPFGEFYTDEAFYGLMDPAGGAPFFEGM